MNNPMCEKCGSDNFGVPLDAAEAFYRQKYRRTKMRTRRRLGILSRSIRRVGR